MIGEVTATRNTFTQLIAESAIVLQLGGGLLILNAVQELEEIGECFLLRGECLIL